MDTSNYGYVQLWIFPRYGYIVTQPLYPSLACEERSLEISGSRRQLRCSVCEICTPSLPFLQAGEGREGIQSEGRKRS